MVDVSFVIPCFRSSESLSLLVRDIASIAEIRGQECEILLVLDSRDKETLRISEELLKQISQVRRLTLSRNFGQHAATVAGITKTVGNRIVTIDDDYQQTPSDAFSLLDYLEAKPEIDLVYGVPEKAAGGGARSLGGKIFRSIMSFSGMKFAEHISPLRAFRGQIREVFRDVRGHSVAVDVILSWVVDTPGHMVCDFRDRERGRSGYSSLKLIRLASSYVISQTTMPLTAGIYLGLFGVITALTLGILTLLQFLLGTILVPGFTMTVLLVIFLGSLQLILIGVIGSYVGQQHQRWMARPSYFVISED